LSRSSPTEAPSIPPTRFDFSPVARTLFADLSFYEAGIDFAEGSAIAIAMRVSWGDRDVSIRLIESTVSRLFDLIIDWANHAFVDHIVTFLKALLSVNDSLFEFRVDSLLLCDKGILVVMNDEKQLQSIYRVNMSTVMERYDSVLDTLMQMPSVTAYVQHSTDASSLYSSVRERMSNVQSLNNSSVVAPGDIIVSETDLSGVVIKLDCAGLDGVNGDYVYREMLDDAGCFTHEGVYQNRVVTFYLYRCKMSSGSHCWFISIPPEGSLPGTKDDVDFYTIAARYDDTVFPTFNDRLPPRGSWTCCISSYNPPPIVSYNNDMLIDTDSGRDDVSLNVGDDEEVFDDSFGSLNGSPREFGGSPNLYD
jgi:hypothetical protein